jgi:hypothetical protein
MFKAIAAMQLRDQGTLTTILAFNLSQGTFFRSQLASIIAYSHLMLIATSALRLWKQTWVST